MVIGADFNGHVGEGNRGDEEVMGRYGFKERNVEGQMVVDFAKWMEMAVVNTYFKKKEDHRVTYRSGGRCTQVDYVLCRRCNLKEIGDCKVLAGDSVARQHRMVVCRMVLEAKKKRRRVRTERRIRWWKLKEEDCSVRFREELYLCRHHSTVGPVQMVNESHVLVSCIQVTYAKGIMKAVVSIKPDRHAFIEETVALRCDIQGGGDTQSSYSWYKDNNRLYNYEGTLHTEQNLILWFVKNSGFYTCSGEFSNISDAVVLTVSAKPKPTVSVNPPRSIYTGDTITLICELQSNGWEFQWYKDYHPVATNTHGMTDNNEGETVYQCSAHRHNSWAGTVYHTEYSDPVTITARVKPKLTEKVDPLNSIYAGDTITLSCELHEMTGWEFLWYKDNLQIQLQYCEQANSCKVIVDYAGEKVYQCNARRRIYNNYYYYTKFSDPVKISAKERPSVLSVSPQNWLTEGDSVTLSCEVTDSSTDWTFSWYTVVPYRDGVTATQNTHGFIMYVELLSDSSRGSGGSYTLSPSALHHTGVYVCRGERGEPAFHTLYSNPQPLWITGESPPVSLIISPSRTQHFTRDSLSLSCEDQSNSTGWTWGSVTGSTCNISFLSTSYTGVYWCESESGENSNPVNITVHGPSHVEAPFSELMLISSVVTASPYLLITIILLVKCYRARVLVSPIPVAQAQVSIKCLGGVVAPAVKALGYRSEGRGFKPWYRQASTLGPLSKALNPLCSRGAVSWLTLRSDPSS
ncbi:Fc receptor-like protein 5 [Silurus meridionalis]|nr:Fc receptor-like protein 5 [Silurus meridionalis]